MGWAAGEACSIVACPLGDFLGDPSGAFPGDFPGDLCGDLPRKGEDFPAIACSRSLVRLLSECDLTMLSFSACMPRMFGMVGLVGGGVGGMSPVMLTSASTSALSNFSAVRGGILKISSWGMRRGEMTSPSVGLALRSVGSVEGIGGGGGVRRRSFVSSSAGWAVDVEASVCVSSWDIPRRYVEALPSSDTSLKRGARLSYR